MVDPADKPVATQELQAINRELAALLRMNPAELTVGADTALGDELVVCGILGGKDVGKSTLINALARRKVSVDAAEVGRGTERPMVYVHAAVQATVAHRLNAIRRDVEIDVTPHDADPIRNVVLVDLPDFDSEFHEHLRVVETIAPLLDRVLWVQTPRKIADRIWVDMFHAVIKDPRNVHCVLNKVDELLADGEPLETGGNQRLDKNGKRAEAFWRNQCDWVAHAIEQAGCPASEEHRFLVAAAFPDPDRFVEHVGRCWDDSGWESYAADRDTVGEIAQLAARDLDRLRSGVLGPVSDDQAHAIKEANRLREHQSNVDRIKRHYELDRTIDLLAHACDADYHQQVLNEAMGPEYCASVAAALKTQMRTDTELADALLDRRVEHWPLLRIVHWPLGWLSRAVGRRVSPTSRRAPDVVGDPFDVEGRSLTDRVELLRSRVLADQAVVASQLKLDEEIPSASMLARRGSTAADRLVPQLENRLLEEAQERYHKPSILRKAALWLVLLWFPFLQPILEGGLEMYVETGAWQLAHGLYRIVSAFSATHLLAGFAVVLGVYVGVLAIMYARGLRTVRRALIEQNGSDDPTPLTDAIDELLVTEVIVPLVVPFQDRLDRLRVLQSRLGPLAPRD